MVVLARDLDPRLADQDVRSLGNDLGLLDNVTQNGSHMGPQPPYWSETSRALYATVLCAFIMTSLVGNSLVVTVVIKNRGMRTRTNMFLCNLAVVDSLCALMDMPLSLITMIKGDWIFNDALCQFNGFALPFLFVTSIHTLMYIGIHKYVSIRYPFSQFLTKTRIRIMIFAAWVWGALSGFLTVFGLNEVSYKPLTAQCGPAYPHNTITYAHIGFVAITCYLIPLIILGVCYLGMFHEIKALSRRMAQNTTMEKELIYMQQRRITLTLFIVLIFFVICWTPYIIYSISVSFLKDKSSIPAYANPVSYWCGYLSSACNPLIYGLMSPAFREGYKELICQRKGRHIAMDDSQAAFSATPTHYTPFSRFRQLLQHHLGKDHDSYSTSSSPASAKSSVTSLANSVLFPKFRTFSTFSLPRNFAYSASVPSRLHEHQQQSILARLTRIIAAEKSTERRGSPLRKQPSERSRPHTIVAMPGVSHTEVTIHVEEVHDADLVQPITMEQEDFEKRHSVGIPQSFQILPSVEESSSLVECQSEHEVEILHGDAVTSDAEPYHNDARHSVSRNPAIQEASNTDASDPPSSSEVNLVSDPSHPSKVRKDSLFGNMLTVPEPGTRPWFSKSLSDETGTRCDTFVDPSFDKASSDSCIDTKKLDQVKMTQRKPRNIFVRLFSSPNPSPSKQKRKSSDRGTLVPVSDESRGGVSIGGAIKRYIRSISDDPSRSNNLQKTQTDRNTSPSRPRHTSDPAIFGEGVSRWGYIKQKCSFRKRSKRKQKDSGEEGDNEHPIDRKPVMKHSLTRHPSIEKLDCMNNEYLYSRYLPSKSSHLSTSHPNYTDHRCISYDDTLSRREAPLNIAEVIIQDSQSGQFHTRIWRSVSDPNLPFSMIEERFQQRVQTKQWDQRRRSVRRKSTVQFEEQEGTHAKLRTNLDVPSSGVPTNCSSFNSNNNNNRNGRRYDVHCNSYRWSMLDPILDTDDCESSVMTNVMTELPRNQRTAYLQLQVTPIPEIEHPRDCYLGRKLKSNTPVTSDPLKRTSFHGFYSEGHGMHRETSL